MQQQQPALKNAAATLSGIVHYWPPIKAGLNHALSRREVRWRT
jgi:hypothetical protein